MRQQKPSRKDIYFPLKFIILFEEIRCLTTIYQIEQYCFLKLKEGEHISSKERVSPSKQQSTKVNKVLRIYQSFH